VLYLTCNVYVQVTSSWCPGAGLYMQHPYVTRHAVQACMGGTDRAVTAWAGQLDGVLRQPATSPVSRPDAAEGGTRVRPMHVTVKL
jgi:hypothetical protein